MAFPLFMLLGPEPAARLDRNRPRLAVGHAAMYGPQASFLSELFGTKVRYSGVRSATIWQSNLRGALSPLMRHRAHDRYKPETWPIAVYMIGWRSSPSCRSISPRKRAGMTRWRTPIAAVS